MLTGVTAKYAIPLVCGMKPAYLNVRQQKFYKEKYMGRGSAGNVIAALCSFFIPGLGQLVQGRVGRAIFHFVAAGVLWVVTFGWLGWIMHLVSAVNAARWQPDG